MIILETERLKLIPLSLENLQEGQINKKKMDKSLGLNSNISNLNDFMKKIYKIKIDKILKDRENYLFYTYWLIVLKESNHIVGEVGFKNIPNDIGEIEVGYGLEEDNWGKGYMAEGLKELIRWAFELSHQKVLTIIACTNKDNKRSQRVLERMNMKIYKEDDNLFWFKHDYINKLKG